MTTKLIVYQLSNYSQDYKLISAQIKSYPKWAKVMDRTWMVKSKKSVSQIRTELSDSIEQRGKIFVIDLASNAWGSFAVNKEVTQWMKDNLSK